MLPVPERDTVGKKWRIFFLFLPHFATPVVSPEQIGLICKSFKKIKNFQSPFSHSLFPTTTSITAVMSRCRTEGIAFEGKFKEVCQERKDSSRTLPGAGEDPDKMAFLMTTSLFRCLIPILCWEGTNSSPLNS